MEARTQIDQEKIEREVALDTIKERLKELSTDPKYSATTLVSDTIPLVDPVGYEAISRGKIQECRNKLLALLLKKEKEERDNIEIHQELHAILILLARYWPQNNKDNDDDVDVVSDPLLLDEIPITDENRIISASGYQYRRILEADDKTANKQNTRLVDTSFKSLYYAGNVSYRDPFGICCPRIDKAHFRYQVGHTYQPSTDGKQAAQVSLTLGFMVAFISVFAFIGMPFLGPGAGLFIILGLLISAGVLGFGLPEAYCYIKNKISSPTPITNPYENPRAVRLLKAVKEKANHVNFEPFLKDKKEHHISQKENKSFPQDKVRQSWEDFLKNKPLRSKTEQSAVASNMPPDNKVLTMNKLAENSTRTKQSLDSKKREEWWAQKCTKNKAPDTSTVSHCNRSSY